MGDSVTHSEDSRGQARRRSANRLRRGGKAWIDEEAHISQPDHLPDPHTCPHCGSNATTATFGFNPDRLSDNEVLLHDPTFICDNCDNGWQAMGYVMVVTKDGSPVSDAGRAVLAKELGQETD